MSRVLVFEPSLSGHRPHYAAVLVEELCRLGADVVFACPKDALHTPEGAEFLKNAFKLSQIYPTTSNGDTNSSSTAREKFLQFVKAIADTNPEHCFVPYADGLSQAWGMHPRAGSVLPKGLVVEGLMMRGGFAYPPVSTVQAIKHRMSCFLSCRAPWTRLHQLDPMVYEKVSRNATNRAKNYLMPELTDRFQLPSKAEAANRLGLDPNHLIVSCPGAVSESKGVDKLIQSLEFLDQDVRLVLVGKHSPRVLDVLAQSKNKGRVVSVNRFASNAEFVDLFAVADAVAVCYPRHVGSSSILIKAAMAGKSIVASNWGWIGWATKHFELGSTCDAANPADIAVAVNQSLMKKQTVEENGLRSAFLEFHTQENHLAHWTDLYRSLNGLPAANKVDFPFSDWEGIR